MHFEIFFQRGLLSPKFEFFFSKCVATRVPDLESLSFALRVQLMLMLTYYQSIYLQLFPQFLLQRISLIINILY